MQNIFKFMCIVLTFVCIFYATENNAEARITDNTTHYLNTASLG